MGQTRVCGQRWRIAPLAEAPESIPVLAAMFEREWAPWYGLDGPGDALADLEACIPGKALPVAFVALDAEGGVIGTAALRDESLPSHEHLAPWLAGLLVAPGHRGKGVAGALVRRVEEEARRRGFAHLYTALSRRKSALLTAQPWEAVDTAPTLRGAATVHRLTLK